MFYAENLMKIQNLGKAWRAANNFTIDTDEVESDISKICNHIDNWVGSDAEDVKGRMSLRTASTLVGGVAKMYKTGVEQLYDDVIKMDEDMLRRKRLRSTSIDSSESDTSSDDLATPEEMRQHTHMQLATSLTPRKIAVSPKIARIEYTMHRSSSASFMDTNVDEANNGDGFSEFDMNIGPEKIELQDTEDVLPETKDQGSQTSPILPRKEVNIFPEDDDTDLPFGYVIIHDSYSSRIPSKIIFSSINVNVNRLN